MNQEPSELRSYIDEQLRSGVDFHALCPDCAGLLTAKLPEGAWCPFCDYSRDTVMREKEHT